MRRLVYYGSVTQDGFIAGPGGEFDYFMMNEDLEGTLNAASPRPFPPTSARRSGSPRRTRSSTPCLWDARRTRWGYRTAS